MLAPLCNFLHFLRLEDDFFHCLHSDIVTKRETHQIARLTAMKPRIELNPNTSSTTQHRRKQKKRQQKREVEKSMWELYKVGEVEVGGVVAFACCKKAAYTVELQQHKLYSFDSFFSFSIEAQTLTLSRAVKLKCVARRRKRNTETNTSSPSPQPKHKWSISLSIMALNLKRWKIYVCIEKCCTSGMFWH